VGQSGLGSRLRYASATNKTIPCFGQSCTVFFRGFTSPIIGSCINMKTGDTFTMPQTVYRKWWQFWKPYKQIVFKTYRVTYASDDLFEITDRSPAFQYLGENDRF